MAGPSERGELHSTMRIRQSTDKGRYVPSFGVSDSTADLLPSSRYASAEAVHTSRSVTRNDSRLPCVRILGAMYPALIHERIVRTGMPVSSAAFAVEIGASI